MVYEFINERIKAREKLLALLIDPDKCTGEKLDKFTGALKKRQPHLILVGGSLISNPVEPLVDYLKGRLDSPVVLYPGSPSHLASNIDALLFLSMISGRNPELLIGHHVVAAPYIKRHNIEAIPTGYMLIDGGSPTSVEYISGTRPIPSDKTDIAVATALAGELLGLKLIYMDAGSGAEKPVAPEMISAVSSALSIPLMVGGGIRTPHNLKVAFNSGAHLAVIGNVLEKDLELVDAFLDVVK